LYEAKMIHHFDHRYATYQADGSIRDTALEEHQDPNFAPMPRYWVEEGEVEEKLVKRDSDGNIVWQWKEPWLLGFRDITNSTNERTAIFSLTPRVAVGHTMPLCFLDNLDRSLMLAFIALTASLAFDFLARQAVGGTHMTYFILRQLAAPRPTDFGAQDLNWLANVAMRLLASDKVIAKALGELSPPNKWLGDDRVRLRAALDAYFMSHYGLEQHDIEYVLDTFEGLNRKELGSLGEHRTRRFVLEAAREQPWRSTTESTGAR